MLTQSDWVPENQIFCSSWISSGLSHFIDSCTYRQSVRDWRCWRRLSRRWTLNWNGVRRAAFIPCNVVMLHIPEQSPYLWVLKYFDKRYYSTNLCNKNRCYKLNNLQLRKNTSLFIIWLIYLHRSFQLNCQTKKLWLNKLR